MHAGAWRKDTLRTAYSFIRLTSDEIGDRLKLGANGMSGRKTNSLLQIGSTLVLSRLCNRHLFVHSFTSREFCYTFYRCPHRLAAKDATLSRWISRVRIPLGAPFDVYPDLLRRGPDFS